MKNLMKIVSCFLILSGIFARAQADPDLEISTNSNTANGPAQSYTLNFLKDTQNPTNVTAGPTPFVTAPNPLSVTLSISNSQYATAVTADPLTQNALNLGYSAGVPATTTLLSSGNGSVAANFTYSGYANSAIGINPSGSNIASIRNTGVQLMVATNQFSYAPYKKLTNAKIYMGDLTFTFSRPVNNPVLHFAGLGGSLGNQTLKTSFELIGSAVALSRLSGVPHFDVTSNVISSTSTGLLNTGNGNGSVLVTGRGITSVSFKIYVTGDGLNGADASTGYTSTDAWATNASGIFLPNNGTGGDLMVISASLGESDLSVTKTVTNDTPVVGSNVTFNIAATNSGMSKSPETKVTDLLPSGFTYVSSTTSVGTYNSVTGIWDIGEMAIGAIATMSITATVKSSGIHTNTATIAGHNTDSNLNNNTASALVQQDSDGDGVPDTTDLDDDNDGILDSSENGPCTATSPLSSTGWKATVYDAPSSTDAWGEISAATTFPTASYYPIATFDYNEFAGTSDAFDFNFATGAIGLKAANPKVTNYVGGTIDGNAFGSPVNTQDDYAIMFRKTITAQEAGTYAFDFLYGDDQLFIYKNGVKVYQLLQAYNVPATNNAATITVVEGDVISMLVAEENTWNTEIRFNGRKIAGTCTLTDTDGDGIPNYLDLDSDNDGCTDAREGDENVLASQLVTASGTLTVGTGSTASNQNLGITVDANGVPTLVNSGGAADIGADQGQGIGVSQDSAKSDCLDSDGDGVPDWSDLDDDNDGILDTEELRCDYNPSVYNFVSGSGAIRNQLLIFDWTGASLTNVNDTFTTSKTVNGITYTAKATVVELVGGYYSGQSPIPSILNTFPGGGNQMFWRYANYGTTATDDLRGAIVFQLARVANNKLSIKFDITATKGGLPQQFDAIAFDAESTTTAEKGLYTTNAADWTLIDNLGGVPTATEASIVGKQLRYDDTQTAQLSLFAYTRGVNVSILGEYSNETNLARAQAMGVGVYLYCDADNDGTFNYLDLDSDNDGCLDALEGGSALAISNLVNASGTVSVGTGSTASNQNLCASSSCVGSTGIPTIVNQTSGQTGGSSTNNLVKAAVCSVCYELPTDLTTSVPVSHGITV
ncbi:MAG: DUF11 domain-containing protein, partial [Flavobacteriales bacterium]